MPGVTLDAGPTSGTFSGGNVNTLTFSGLTIGTGNCLVAVFLSNVSPTFTAVTWGAQNLGLTPTVSQTVSGVTLSIWVLFNPTLGNQNLTWTWSSAAAQASIWGASLNNASSFVSTLASGNSANPSYSAPSAAQHLCMDILGNNAGDIISNGGPPQIQIMDFNPGVFRLDSSYVLNQSTASFSWSTAGGSIPYNAIMLDFTPLPSSYLVSWIM